jgi:hypothetical protein
LYRYISSNSIQKPVLEKMINKKNDWYSEAKQTSHIMQEAGMGDTLKKAILAVSLILAGYSVFEVSERTGLTPEQVNSAVTNEEIISLLERENFTLTELDVPTDSVEKTTPHGLPTTLDLSEIENLIRLHEVSGAKRVVTIKGKKIDIRKVYEDPIHGWKVPTIGVGYNLNKPEAASQIKSFGLDYNKVRSGQQMLTDDQVDVLYSNDVQNAIRDAKTFLPNFDDQPSTVKTIVSDMSFNMGLNRLSTFKNFRSALTSFDFKKAAQEMRNSNWAKQTKSRANRLIKMMESLGENTPTN